MLLPATTVCEAGEAEIEKSGVPQPAKRKDPMNVLQLKDPLAGRNSFVYYSVQSSSGSIRRAV